MSRLDLFCVPEDRHRVILLVDLLERAGQSLALHTEPVSRPSDPLVVVCTAAGLRYGWLVDLFDAGRRVVAVRLDDTPLPRPADEVINLQAWPARSADSRVGGLVRLLQDPASVGATRRTAPGLRGAARGAAGRGSATRRAPAAKRGAKAGKAGWLGPALVVGAAVLIGLLLWEAAPPGSREQAAAEGDVGTADRLRQPPAPVAGQDEGAVAGADHRAPDPVERDDPAAGSPDSDAGPLAAERPGQGGSDVAYNSSIAHLCRAETPEAALAWLDVLDWQQRLRLEQEACVARLLERPGFEVLQARLDRG